MSEDSKYVVLVGAERLVSSFVNRGDLVEKGQVVEVGPLMAGTLLRQEFVNPKTDEMMNMWREATDKEINGFRTRLDSVDPATADPKLIAEAARLEALKRGHVEHEAAKIESRRFEESGRTDIPSTEQPPMPPPPQTRRRSRG